MADCQRIILFSYTKEYCPFYCTKIKFNPISMSDNEFECRSTDGSDSEGSLKDFVIDDEGSEEETPDTVDAAPTDLAQSLVDEFPFDRALLEETTTQGPRRSRRSTKPVTRYVDDQYAKLMYDDVDADGLEDDEDIAPPNKEEEDEDFVASSESDSESDSESEEDEEEAEETNKQGASKPALKITIDDSTASRPRKKMKV